ncbi:MAG: NPCBM/NEW2 domain-containing protein [Ignavibacteriae bacterium]|nr:NPCBM/NEW2 domain-containing protein [Ignavibacteriota bacterium]
MRRICCLHNIVVFVFFFATVSPPLYVQASSAQEASRKWPHPIPCRIEDGANADLFVMTLGDAQTPLATGIFDPTKDEVKLNGGRIIKNYYRDSLGIKYFNPINKSYFPLPPSGWCSWYYYYQEIDEPEIQRNAKWIADNLKDYGATYVQIDDGWQGTGHGMGENRDWTTIDKRFSHGIDSLAQYIKHLGLKAGIWLAAHGQSNPAVIQANPGVFLLKPDGSSASDTWVGRFLVDPSNLASHVYLRDLFLTLTGWGYDYFKIDGQPIVIQEYGKSKPFMAAPSDDISQLYRGTVQTIRSAIGRERYLLGCWGTPVEAAGILNGSRTGGDVVPGWSGFMAALDATMRYAYLHNIVWYSDPDVMLVRSPLRIDQARVWATLQGLTGQAMMASDRMMDLSGERVELLKRVFPAVDIRPLDLFPSDRQKRIWDLKVNHLGRSYDVVGVFNFKENAGDHVYLNWSELGIPDTTPVHVFDFWNKEYLGCWEAGMGLELSPTSCRVFTLQPATDHVQLVSTSRHITQGWVDLAELAYNEKTNSYNGKSKVIREDPYELRFVFPRGKNFVIKSAAAANLPVNITNHQGWATVQFTSPITAEVAWRVSFEKSDFYHYPVRQPKNLSVEPLGLDGALVRWSPQYYLTTGYQVSLDGKLLGFSPGNAFPLKNIDPTREHVVQVSSVWEDGTTSKEKAEVKFIPAIPNEVRLSDLEAVRSTIGWGTIEMNKSVTGKPLTIGGKVFQKGIGTHAASVVEYNLRGLFETLAAQVGIDDGNGSEKGSVEFIVLADGKELWRSGLMKKEDGAKPLSVSIAGVRKLLLRVTDGGDGIDYDHADWADPIVQRRRN